jgi:hypothetical protein
VRKSSGTSVFLILPIPPNYLKNRFTMGYFQGDTEKVAYSKETVEDINELGLANLPDRKIPRDVLEKSGVKVALSQEDGRTIEAIYLPYIDTHGVVRGYKKRDLTKPKTHKFHSTTVEAK